MLLDEWNDVPCPLIGMLHLPPLAGSPRSRLTLAEIRDFVLRDCQSLAAGGANGLLLENFGDVPFTAGRVSAASVAQMTWLAGEVRRQFPELPLGINVLRNDGLSALAIAHAVDARFIRVNVLAGARLTDQGVITGKAHELMCERRRLGAERIQILADVDVKHSVPLAPLPLVDEAADLVHRALADGLIVTGRATGQAAATADFQSVKSAAAGRPVFIGSGVTPQSVSDLLPLADGLIVGSGLKLDGIVANPVDSRRVRELVLLLRALVTRRLLAK